MSFDGIVLAGGSARRLDGADKAEIEIGGSRLLDRVVGALREAGRVVVVGPERPSRRQVTWARESPPGAGPAAALAEGLRHCGAPVVVVLAVDMPYVDEAVVRRLVRSVGSGDGALLVDEDGRVQPLAAAYRAERLQAGLDALRSLDGAAVHDAVAGLLLERVSAGLYATDIDTWDEVAAARRAQGR